MIQASENVLQQLAQRDSVHEMATETVQLISHQLLKD